MFEIALLTALEFFWTEINVTTENSVMPGVTKKQTSCGLQPILLVFYILIGASAVARLWQTFVRS